MLPFLLVLLNALFAAVENFHWRFSTLLIFLWPQSSQRNISRSRIDFSSRDAPLINPRRQAGISNINEPIFAKAASDCLSKLITKVICNKKERRKIAHGGKNRVLPGMSFKINAN